MGSVTDRYFHNYSHLPVQKQKIPRVARKSGTKKEKKNHTKTAKTGHSKASRTKTSG
jgi:hypothetical protein